VQTSNRMFSFSVRRKSYSLVPSSGAGPLSQDHNSQESMAFSVGVMKLFTLQIDISRVADQTWTDAISLALFLPTMLLGIISLIAVWREAHYGGMHKARFESPYIGFSQMNFSLMNIGASINKPLELLQISNGYPWTLYPAYNRSDFAYSVHGWVTMDRQRFAVNPMESTVAHFITADYGLEECSLILNLTSGSTSLISQLNSHRIDIWEIPINYRIINAQNIPWDALQRKRLLVANVTLTSNNSVILDQIRCKATTYLTFLISCTPSSQICDLDLTFETKGNNGLYINQKSFS